MSVVALNRRFIEWDEKDAPDPDMLQDFGLGEGGIGWDELLSKFRVVILAEAGSGKSTELVERARITAANHEYAFHTTVEDVGHEGLIGALDVHGRGSLSEWHTSVGEAWFFIDSVDEAKSGGVRFEKALRRLSEGIHGAEHRAHIILSGRITDWEFRKDLQSLNDRLPVPTRRVLPAPTAEEELLRVIRRQNQPSEEEPAREPLVVLMAPLDRERVRLFAAGKGAPNVHRLIDAIEAGNFWRFARRPLDLDWLVRFWQSEGRLGSLSEMVERGITERLRETNTDRARVDKLDTESACQAVERIAAAMTFCHQATVAIPDSVVAPSSESPLDLAEVLPDWPTEDRLRLFSRAVFEPATLGRVRFHNDNRGVVRGFLTARWLVRLRNANLSTRTLFDLLFANSYGVDVIRPSLNETAAWLSLWDKDVANEVVRRSPLLLLTSGDPACLAPDIRRRALLRLLPDIKTGDTNLPFWWDSDTLKRFAQPDMGSIIAEMWPEHKANATIAVLLLRMVWLGRLGDCAKIAFDATLDATLPPLTRIYAGRALLVTADEFARQDYAAMVKRDASSLPGRMAGDAIMDLFPGVMGIRELLEILEHMDVGGRADGLAFEWDGSRLADRLNAPSDLEDLLRGLLRQVGGINEHAHYEPSAQEQIYFPAIASAALRLLQLAPLVSTPDTAVDAILLLCNRRGHSAELLATLNSAIGELHRTSSRRRYAFWRVANTLRRPSPEWRRTNQLWQMTHSGYPPGLHVEDLDWLVPDGMEKGGEDLRLSIDAALAVYQSAGEPADLLARIAAAVSTDPVALKIYRELTQRQQTPIEQVKIEREIRELQNRGASELTKREQSWIDFIRDLRADPVRVARLKTPMSSGVSNDLLHLWRLLSWATGDSHFAISSVSPLEKIAGTEVAEAVRMGLMARWRNLEPHVKSQRQTSERDAVWEFDLLGLAGVSLEAASVSDWAERLSPSEATKGACYATLELNGFPCWLPVLAMARPVEVRDFLIGEVIDEITRPEIAYYDTLYKVRYAGEQIAALVSSRLLTELEARRRLPYAALFSLLHIIVTGIHEESKACLISLGVERFETENDADAAAEYLAAAFIFDPTACIRVLAAKLATSDGEKRAAILDRFLRAAFGDSASTSFARLTDVPPDTLLELVRMTFRTRASVSARERPAGEVYSPGEADFSAEARSAVFNRFVETPGAATYQVLLQFQTDPTCRIPASRLLSLAKQRAVRDADAAPWKPSDPFEFERSHETGPRTARDLQSVLLRRIEDIQHDLLHGDFAQGKTLKSLPKEVDVQNWVADRLRLKQGRSFSVEREPHVIEEKEPDIRVRAKASDASVAMEIKVAHTWTLQELHDALEKQLCGRYLRASDGRYGVLLLVYQQARAKGWEDTATGAFFSFAEVVDRLHRRALVIAGMSHDSPQPEVAWIDVSSS